MFTTGRAGPKASITLAQVARALSSTSSAPVSAAISASFIGPIPAGHLPAYFRSSKATSLKTRHSLIRPSASNTNVSV